MNYYIADTHFYHENIIRLCNRPFKDVQEMNSVMAENWNAAVKPEDTVYVVGDFGYRVGTQDLIKMINSLNGHKILIRGNHDIKALNDPVYRACYDGIYDIHEVVDNGVRIVLCHYPLVEWNNYFREAWHFFGHIHNADTLAQHIMSEIPKSVNIGADCIGFTPRTAAELMIQKEKE